MNDPEVFEGPCAICRVRTATILCDYVTKYDNGIIFVRNWRKFQEINAGGHNETCDLPLCDKCAQNVGTHADLCPHHYQLQKQSVLPKHLEMARMRQKAKILNESYEKKV